MVAVTKNDVPNSPQEKRNERVARYIHDAPPLYKERRQKDMAPDSQHYHWDWIDWSDSGDE